MRTRSTFVLLASLAACGPSSETVDRQRVATKIDQLRAVDDTDPRTRLAHELEALDVKAPDAVAARDVCARAYLRLGDVDRLVAVASAILDPASTADPRSAAPTLQQADTAATEAQNAMQACNDASAAIRVRR